MGLSWWRVSVYDRHERQFTATRTLISSFLKSALTAAVLSVLPELALAQPIPNGAAIHFDIPSQPLADALVAFGATTGLEVFYDGALAVGRHSAPVSGTLTPAEGLRELLAGTGYVAVATADPSTLTIIPATTGARPAAAGSAQLSQYEPYFATLQSLVGDALCGSDETNSRQVIVSLWLASSGVVSRAELIGEGANSAGRDAVTRGLQGLKIGTSLPPGLPQPIVMVIFPPAVGETAGCSPQRRAAGN